MKFFGAFLLFFGVGLLIIFSVGCAGRIYTQLEVGRDIGAPLNRAQVTSDPTAMDGFLAKVQAGLEKHGYTSGHWQPINKNDDNDFAVAYASVIKMRDRLSEIKTMDRGSVEYNVALDDLRGTVRELRIGQQDRVGWDFVWIWPLLCVGLVFCVAGVFIVLSDDY